MKQLFFLLYKNDNSKTIKEMELIGTYKNINDVPKIKNTVLTIRWLGDE